MSMFLNYHNIADNYKPNNTVCSFPVGKSYTKLDPVKASKPYEEYNTKGELIGYFWRQGETLNLEFNIDGEITVESDAIVYVCSGDYPDVTTKAEHLYQRAYNTADLRSWTCVQIADNYYIWQEDDDFTYDESSAHSIYVDARTFLTDKYLDFKIYNFRLEPIYEKMLSGTTQVVIPITQELSKRMKKGIYYCSLSVVNDTTNLPIFTSHDCTLLVK